MNEPYLHKCAWVAGGQRCQNPGSIANGAVRGSDIFYCPSHHSCKDGATGHKIVMESRPGPGIFHVEESFTRACIESLKSRGISTIDEMRAECLRIVRHGTGPVIKAAAGFMK